MEGSMFSADLFWCDESDVCYRAVTTAYLELCEGGAPETIAFKSAITVFKYYHPEVPTVEVPYVVAEWVGAD